MSERWWYLGSFVAFRRETIIILRSFLPGVISKWLLRELGEGNGTPLQYSCLENPMDGGAWKAAVHGVAEGQTGLRDFTFTFHFHALEKEMATHSNVLAWRILGTEEPGGLPSIRLHRVGHDWSDLAAAAARTEVISIHSEIEQSWKFLQKCFQSVSVCHKTSEDVY